nr:hypothetical protein [Bradyrhizobium sp. NBAIM08]
MTFQDKRKRDDLATFADKALACIVGRRRNMDQVRTVDLPAIQFVGRFYVAGIDGNRLGLWVEPDQFSGLATVNAIDERKASVWLQQRVGHDLGAKQRGGRKAIRRVVQELIERMVGGLLFAAVRKLLVNVNRE